MAKTAKMRLVELMVLKEDIDEVVEFLGKKGNFQFQQKLFGAHPPFQSPQELDFWKSCLQS